METPHFTVNCRYCGETIPLAPYNADLHYKLTGSSFEARHAKCHGLGFYSVDDLRRPDIEHVPGLVPNLGFAEQILTR
jgi:hypothetical protein